MTNFRISTWPDGHKSWWRAGEKIPAAHTDIRPATADETASAQHILDLDADHRLIDTAEGEAAGERMRALLAA